MLVNQCAFARWDALPAPTVRANAVAFTMLIRAACVTYLKQHCRHRGLPYQLGRLTYEDPMEVATWLLDLKICPLCMRGRFAKWFLDVFDTVSKLATAGRRAMILVGLVMRITTQLLECRNSVLRDISKAHCP